MELFDTVQDGQAEGGEAGESRRGLEVLAELRERIEQLEDAGAIDDSPRPDFTLISRRLKPAVKGGPPNLLQRLCSAQLEIKTVVKDGTNSEYRFKFASVDSVVGACRAALAKNGIVVLLSPVRKKAEAYQTSGGKTGRSVEQVSCVSVLNAEDPDECMEYEISGLVQQIGDKQEWVLSAQFRKYALIELLNLERGNEDAEGRPDAPPDSGKSAAGPISGRSGNARSYDQRSRAPQGAPLIAEYTRPPAAARPTLDRTRDMLWRALEKAAPTTTGKTITEPQQRRLFAMAKEAGYSAEMVVDELASRLRLSPPMIPWSLYDGVIQTYRDFPLAGAPPREPGEDPDADVS